jgi:twinkle protein
LDVAEPRRLALVRQRESQRNSIGIINSSNMINLRHSAQEVSRRLADRVESVCLRLLPGGTRKGAEWLAGDVQGGQGQSLKVQLSGEHAGRWRDWAEEGRHGDLLDLWAAARGIPLAEAFREAKEYLGMLGPEPATASARKYQAPPVREQAGVIPVAEEGVVMRYLQLQRGLDPAVVRRFGVEGLPSAGALVFPCHAPDGTLVNRSYRTVPGPGESGLGARKRVWQDAGCAPSLFGWQALPKSAWEKRTVLLCEGQIDAMTWTQWGVPALSVPNGTGAAWIDHEWDQLELFDHIYLSFDMDGAGAENANRVMQRLGRHRCLLVKLPHKDANECLLEGCTSDDAEHWIAQARPPQIHKLLLGQELHQRLMSELEPKPEPFTLDFLRVAWPHQGFYFRPHELTVWTGAYGQGKSTFLNFVALNLLSQLSHTGVFMASMEMRAESTLRRLTTTYFQEPATPSHAVTFLEKFGTRLVFADVVGYISQDMLLEMMMFSFQRHGVQHFIVDSLMRVDGLEEEFAEQGRFMNRLQEFAKETGAHVHLVAHPRKSASGQRQDRLEIKGSSLIANNADNIVAVSRNPEKDALRRDNKLTPLQDASLHDTEIRVEKQRENGWLGMVPLRFFPRSSWYERAS